MELRFGQGMSGPLSRWVETGGPSPRWGSEAAPEGRTFEDDLALLEGQILAERLGRERPRAASPTPDPRRQESIAAG